MDTALSVRRSLAILAVGILLAGVILWQLSQPVKVKVSERFTERGDGYFVAQNFEQAEEEYHKALRYNPENSTAKQNLDLATKAEVDIAAAADFFTQHGVAEVGEKLAVAKKGYTNPKEALKVGVEFFNNGELRFARYPLERAVQLDPDYPEAWHYLALTYQEYAKNDAQYKQQAEDAFKKRDSLTPKYLNLQ